MTEWRKSSYSGGIENTVSSMSKEHLPGDGGVLLFRPDGHAERPQIDGVRIRPTIRRSLPVGHGGILPPSAGGPAGNGSRRLPGRPIFAILPAWKT